MEVADKFYLLDIGEGDQLEEGSEYSPTDRAIARGKRMILPLNS